MFGRKNSSKITCSIKDFSDCIKELELIDPLLTGGKYTWFKGITQGSARIDRFLFFSEWAEEFRMDKQEIMQRIISDLVPLQLLCGEWGETGSYFKFENWWMEVE